MFYRDDFPAACLWPLAAEGYRLAKREREPVRGFRDKYKRIEPVNPDSWVPRAPLADHELFASFVKLGASERPSESKCLRWVQKYGLLRRRDEMHDSLIIERVDAPPGSPPAEWWLTDQELAARETREARKFVERRSLNQEAVSLDDFRSEVQDARSALNLYGVLRSKDLNDGNVAELKTLVNAARDKESHVQLSGVESGLARIGDAVLETSWTDTLVFRAALVLEAFVKQKVADVRLDFFAFTEKLAPAPVYAPVQSWTCPDLLSAIYLQFYLWMTKAWPMRICANERCSTPFPATRTDKIYCTGTCRSAARD